MRLTVERPGEGADYVSVTAFGKLAQSCNTYLAKGRQVAVNGRLSHSEWKAESGERSGARDESRGPLFACFAIAAQRRS